MNERIRELSKQAWEWAEQQEYNDPTQEFSDILEQKFAELIVRECASLIEKNHPEFSCKEAADNLYRRAGRMDAIDEILRHFGVEE